LDDEIWVMLSDATGYDRADMKESDDLILDLGMDSLELARLESEVESRLSVTLTSEQVREAGTVGGVMALLRRLMAEKDTVN